MTRNNPREGLFAGQRRPADHVERRPLSELIAYARSPLSDTLCGFVKKALSARRPAQYVLSKLCLVCGNREDGGAVAVKLAVAYSGNVGQGFERARTTAGHLDQGGIVEDHVGW